MATWSNISANSASWSNVSVDSSTASLVPNSGGYAYDSSLAYNSTNLYDTGSALTWTNATEH